MAPSSHWPRENRPRWDRWKNTLPSSPSPHICNRFPRGPNHRATALLWNGSREEFAALVESLNQNDIGLSFTSEIHATSLPFLDVRIIKSPEGTIQTTIYRKPTATNSLLHWQSSHPFALKKGIPYGQFLRLRRNCTQLSDFKNQASEMANRFREKGYPESVISRAYNRARTP